MSNKELAEELRKTILRKFKKRKVHSSFLYNIWGSDLVDMQLISKFNKELYKYRLLLCGINIFSKYSWFFLLKDKKAITITNTFQKTLIESNRKSNKIWVVKGREFCYRSIKSLLQNNDIEMY